MRSDAFIDVVHSLLEWRSVEAAFDPEVRFFSPVSFRSYDGRDLVVLILTEGPMKLFEDFEYVHAIEDPEEPTAALIFRTRVGDRWMDGLDLLTFGDDGLITELKVMLRPKSGGRRDGRGDGQALRGARPHPADRLITPQRPSPVGSATRETREIPRRTWRSARLE